MARRNSPFFSNVGWRLRRVSSSAVVSPLVLFALSFGYLFVVSPPTAQELLVYPRWRTELESYDAASAGTIAGALPEEQSVVAFRVSDVFGYVSRRGVITYMEAVAFDVSYSDTRFANYTRSGIKTTIKDTRGALVTTISQRGYPRLADERVALLSLTGDTVTEWNTDTTLRWRREHHTIISDIAMRGEHTLIGLLDGSALLINRDGTVNYTYRDDDPHDAVIVGVALSQSRRLSALASGVDPTYLVVLENRPTAPRVLARVALPHTLLRLQPLYFLSEEGDLFFERGGTLYHFDLELNTLTELERTRRTRSLSLARCCAALIVSSRLLEADSGVVLEMLSVKGDSILELPLPHSNRPHPYFVRLVEGDPLGILVGFERALYYVEAQWE